MASSTANGKTGLVVEVRGVVRRSPGAALAAARPGRVVITLGDTCLEVSRAEAGRLAAAGERFLTWHKVANRDGEWVVVATGH